MEKLRHKIMYSVLGASTGLAGMTALARCSGNGCSTCLGCAVPGIGILAMTLINVIGKKYHKGATSNNGLA
jgi:hypothetical protein